ncbi:MAG: MMPL family transporter [Actinobacteria bacterium]|nr:MMPL family transporter [Actinomycetota bacterium]
MSSSGSFKSFFEPFGRFFAGILPFFARLCRDHAKAVVIFCVLFTIPVAVGITFLEVRAGQRDLIPTKYEAARTIEEVNELFGGTTNEYPLVNSDALLSYPMIKKFIFLEQAMAEALDENDYVYVQHYLSAFGPNMLAQARQRAAEDYGISEQEAEVILPDIETVFSFGEGMLQEDPNNPGEMKPFEQIIEEGVGLYLANPVAYKWTVAKEGSALLSESGDYAKVLIKVNPDMDSAESKAFATEVEDFFRSYFEGGEVPATVYVSGDPSIDKDLENYAWSSTWLFLIMAVVLLILLLYLTFQRFTDVLLPLAVILLSAVWIYGFMGWIGFPYTLVSVMIAPLVLGISLGNLVYMMGRFYEEYGIRRDPRPSAYRAVTTVGVAVFLACITTIIAFLTFMWSDFDVLQQFGSMTAIGIGVCFLLSVTFLPALMILREDRRKRLGMVQVPRGVKIFAVDSNSRVDRFLGRIYAISQDRPGAVVVIYGFIILICIMGTFRLTTTPDLRALAPQDIPSLQAQYLQESIFGGVQQDVVLLTGDVLEPEVLAAMQEFQDQIAQSPYFEREGSLSVGELISDFRKEMGKAGPEPGPEPSLPADRAEAEEDLAEISGLFGPQEGKQVSDDHQAALIAVFSEGARNNEEMTEKNRVLNEAAAASFGDMGISYKVGGITPLTVEMLGNLVPTQIRTAILALILSGLVLILIFRSITYGLATLTVLIAGIVIELGFLALMGWTLDMMTVLIATMIIGIGIDYGIHITHRFLEEYSPGSVGVAEALNITVVRVGKPLLASMVSTAVAFLILSASKMQPIRRFGIITALSLAVSLAASLLVLPSVITLIARRRQPAEVGAAQEAGDLKPAEADGGA